MADPVASLEERVRRLEQVVARLEESIRRGIAAPGASAEAAPPGAPAPGASAEEAPAATAYPGASAGAPAAAAYPGASAEEAPAAAAYPGASAEAAPPSAAYPGASAGAPAAAAYRGASAEAPAPRARSAAPIDVNFWFRIVGIGLILFGTVFLFKYSADESRAIMTLRVLIGIALGGGLVIAGMRLRRSERHFSQVLLGGGIGIWYISGFAAFQVFALLPQLPALLLMAAITIFAFVLAVGQQANALAVIGVLGGLGTPFLLYETRRGAIGPSIYICLVLAGAAGIFLRCGWRSLLWTSVVSGGIALLSLVGQYRLGASTATAPTRLAVELGLVFHWLVFAIVPVARDILSVRDPARWPPATFTMRRRDGTRAQVPFKDVPVLATTLPLFALVATTLAWSLDERDAGILSLCGAILYAVAARYIARFRLPGMTIAHVVAAIVLGTTALALLLEGDAQTVALATWGLMLHVLAVRQQSRGVAVCAHALSFVVALIALFLIVFGSSDRPILTGEGLSTFWAIVALVLSSNLQRVNAAKYVYRYVAHLLFLGWWASEFASVTNGEAIVSAAWGIYAITLVVIGLRRSSRQVLMTGLLTLLLVVAKLFLVDLSEVRAILRVVLFLGFGGLLLTFSHWVRKLMPGAESDGDVAG